MADTSRRVIVVGGGASGVLAAVNLSRALGRGAEIVIVEKSATPGRGLAYATRDPNHLLNVRVSNMSAFPNDPDHFFRWLQTHGPAQGIGCSTHFCFVPRKVYGAYLESLYEAALMETVRAVTATAVAVTPTVTGVAVRFDDGSRFEGRAAVLATGHDAKPPRGDGIVDAWDPAATAGIPDGDEVLILGTGLTMVDVVLTLRRQGHRGRITALSRRGLAPMTHAASTPLAIPVSDVPFGAPLSAMLGWLRRVVRRAEAEGASWRGAIDGLRPRTRALWEAMTDEQRARFLRHARPWWDIHRHRMAPTVAETIENLVADRRLQIVAGRLLSAEPDAAGGTTVTLRRRRQERPERLTVTRVIDATGLPGDPSRSPNPVLRSLFEAGHARLGPLDLGLDLADDYALIDRAGRTSDRLFAVGPLGRGAFWEMIAIPDIRQQCAELADDLALRFGEGPLRRRA
jgi:uncharacterized NAD(P)/FAD-binding protein YdhS